MQILLADLSYSLRSLRKSPSFAIIAILTLALGIGSATAIFSVVDAVLLAPLPFHEPDRLIHVATTLTTGAQTSGLTSQLHFTRLADARTIEGIAGTYNLDVALLDPEERPVRSTTYHTTAGYLPLLGATMHMGRVWTPEEHAPGSPQSLVLSYRFWRDVYGADPDIVGATVLSNGGPIAVLGVASPGFDYPPGTDAWGNLRFAPQFWAHMLDGYARLAPNVTIEQARAEFGPVLEKIIEDNPGSQNPARVFVLTPLRERLLGDMSSGLVILFGATGTLLLIACANVSNLQLSRAAARSREIAIRSSLGAQRGRVVRQLLTESVVMAGASGVAGVALAAVVLRTMLRLAPGDLPRLDEVTLDLRVLAFALAIALASGILFGLAPAVRLASTDLRSVLQEESRGSSSGPGRNRAFAILTSAQVALAVVLVIGAGLLMLSFQGLRNVDLGFDADNVLTVSASMSGNNYPDNTVEVAGAIRTFADRLREMGGIDSVGATTTLPLGHSVDFIQDWTEVGGAPEGVDLMARMVSPGFFDAVRIPQIDGRALNNDDTSLTTPVAVVNQAAAAVLFGGNPIGREVVVARGIGGPRSAIGMMPRTNVEIVGVVGDARFRWIDRPPTPEIYLPLAQAPFRQVHFAIRTEGNDPLGLIGPVREAIGALDATLPLEFDTQHAVVNTVVQSQRFTAQLLGAFAGAALFLASVGIYGVIAYSVGQRKGEMAIRKSLGAETRDIVRLVLRQGLAMSGIGIAVGLVVAWLGRRVVAAQLHEISASDPRVFVGVAIVLLVAACIATYVPARRATTVPAAAVLRTD